MHFRTAIQGLAGALAVFLPVCPAVFGQTPGLAPTDPEAQMVKAEILLEESKPTEALAILENLLREFPEMPGVRYQTALAHHLAGNSERAHAVVEEALARGESGENLHLLMGAVSFYRGDLEKAKKAYEKVQEMNENNSVALYNLSEILRREGRYAEAVEKLQRASKIDTKSKVLPLKTKLAQVESGRDLDIIELEVFKRQGEENLSEEWLLTAAAFHLKLGNARQATEMLLKARTAMDPASLRTLLKEDTFFKSFRNHAALVEVLGPPEEVSENAND